MSISYPELREQAEKTILAQYEATQARLRRDTARATLREVELDLRYEGSVNGSLDGKNAEVREAQEANLRRTNPRWQTAVDAARRAEEEAVTRQAEADAEMLRLKAMQIGVNMQIAESVGPDAKLLREVSLSSPVSS